MPPRAATLLRCERLRWRGEDTWQMIYSAPAVRPRPPRAQTPRSPSGSVPPRQLPLRADEVAGVAVRIAFQVILVLRLRLPEIASGREFGHDLARPQP